MVDPWHTITISLDGGESFSVEIPEGATVQEIDRLVREASGGRVTARPLEAPDKLEARVRRRLLRAEARARAARQRRILQLAAWARRGCPWGPAVYERASTPADFEMLARGLELLAAVESGDYP